MMSGVVEESDDMMCCAACGTAGIDEIKLKDCSACKLVKYCSVKCQKEHRPQHKRACKKRAAELRDEILFKQHESTHLGDCPICCLPLQYDNDKSTMMSCCCKTICNGCEYANRMREFEGKLKHTCPFCRHPLPNFEEEIRKNYMKRIEEEADKNYMKRIEANDPVAFFEMGLRRRDEGDIEGAFKYMTKAAELGDAGAHYVLSGMYAEGKVVEKDEKKEMHHLEEAAIAGNPDARYNLGCVEGKSGRYERAMKHFIVSANMGHNKSLDSLKNGFMAGVVSKDEFAAALRGHQAAIDATKSPQRDVASAALKK